MEIKELLKLYKNYNYLNENIPSQKELKRKSLWFRIFTLNKKRKHIILN